MICNVRANCGNVYLIKMPSRLLVLHEDFMGPMKALTLSREQECPKTCPWHR